MNIIEKYEQELNTAMNQLNENYSKAGFSLEQMAEIEEHEIPLEVQESNRRILENLEGIRRRLARVKQVSTSHPI